MVLDLVDAADVVVNNFRPGVMERMGFGYEDLKATQPAASSSRSAPASASKGPNPHKGGQDVLAQAMTGVMARKPDPAHPTSIYPTALCDYSAGMHLVQGILLALLQREKTGEGQQVAVTLYSSMLAMQMQEAAAQMMRGKDLNWARLPADRRLRDHRPADRHGRRLQAEPAARHLPGAGDRGPVARTALCRLRPPDGAPRRAAGDLPRALRRPRLRSLARRGWKSVDILCAPVRTLAEALEDEQTLVNRHDRRGRRDGGRTGPRSIGSRSTCRRRR